MSVPQGVFAPSGPHQYHLELVLRRDVPLSLVAQTVGSLWDNALTGRVSPGQDPVVAPSGGATGVVVGFGPDVWAALAPGDAPATLRPAFEIRGADGAGVPATQRDLWVWLNGADYATVLDAALGVVDALAPVATVVAEQACFVHQDSRTWEGFIDGTENPGPFELGEVVIVPEGEPGAGGTTVLVQRWLNERIHDFDALPVVDQEQVMGRTKRNSEELAPGPPTSHVARNILEVDGEELHIFRRNIPFGTVSERGYIFVGFAADQSRVTRMLERMYGADAAPGETPVVDALTRFVRPVTSSSYFVPSFDALTRVGAAPEDDD